MNDIDNFIETQYPQLADVSFFDYQKTAPISVQQIQRINKLSQKLIASPHSSEEQSEFDRTLARLRTTIAEVFSTNLINYSVVLLQTPEAAMEQIFESFPWSTNSHYIIDPSFKINMDNSRKFAENSAAVEGNINLTSKSQSLFCTSFSDKAVEEANQYLKRGSGVHHVLFDATPSAPFSFPNLTKNSFDFFILSLKKICGIEICALLMKLHVAEMMRPMFYGGGAVAFGCARDLSHRSFKSHTKRFENGTPPLVSIFSAYEGLIQIIKLGDIQERINNLMKKLTDGLGQFAVVKCEVDDWEKKIILKIDDRDSQDLQIKYIEHKVIVGIDSDHNLCASFGFGVCEKDVDNFLQASKIILG